MTRNSAELAIGNTGSQRHLNLEIGMNMKRVHANHIIAELTRRLADRDEEITRLTALCQEPVMLSDAEPYECHLARAIKERT